MPGDPPRSAVYGSARRGPHPVVLVALAVLVLGVLAGIVLALPVWHAAGRPVTGPPGGSDTASAGSPPAGASAGRTPSPSAAASSASASAGPVAPAQVAGIRGDGSGLCLDLQPDQPGSGGGVQLRPCTPDAPSQRWQFTRDFVVNVASGLCLAVAGAATDDGGRVQQEPCADVPHHRWRLSVGPDGAATFAVQHSGRCLDVTGGGTAPGTPVQQFGCNSTPAQRWFLQPA